VDRALRPLIRARPHDLVRLADPDPILTGTEPTWVGAALAAAPWIVIRRARAPAGHLAAGVRGPARHQRHAMLIPAGAAAGIARPEDLRPAASVIAPETPALAALRECRPILDGLGRPWGPTGSAGFELATGYPATTQDSDLDLLIRLGALSGFTRAAALASKLSGLPARVDCYLETGHGAVALAELATHPDKIVLRTSDGPRLVTLEQAMMP
jgi:phosphoribosyl-dephospho-CoA transferase